MTSIAASSSGWDDWLKWMPGWLAFAWAVGNGIFLGIRKWRDHRNKLALGPADNELRQALAAARSRFEDVIAQGRRADWFRTDERRETGRTVEDLVGRRTDQILRNELTEVANAWKQTAANAPRPSRPQIRSMNHVTTPQERAESEHVRERFGKETEEARKGLEHIKAALTRLDELERKTHGR
ncbi:hypothetical protein [Streptomyces sp. NPDC051554]|uniref:hypothetical protein n=1 Tax=Streptomyces sp. NPDC051554 TaxID=3365656 RepID=UPI0037B7BCD9